MLTVGALKKMIPLKDIAEIDPNVRYLVRLPKNTAPEVAEIIYNQLRQAEVNSLLIIGDDVQFYDLKEKVGK